MKINDLFNNEFIMNVCLFVPRTTDQRNLLQRHIKKDSAIDFFLSQKFKTKVPTGFVKSRNSYTHKPHIIKINLHV